MSPRGIKDDFYVLFSETANRASRNRPLRFCPLKGSRLKHVCSQSWSAFHYVRKKTRVRRRVKGGVSLQKTDWAVTRRGCITCRGQRTCGLHVNLPALQADADVKQHF